MLPATLFGNFQIINIYVAKCLEKRCRETIESKLNDTQCGFRHGTTDHISLSRKILINLRSKPKTSSRALSTSRKNTTVFLEKLWGVLRVYGADGRLLQQALQVTVFLLISLCPCRES